MTRMAKITYNELLLVAKANQEKLKNFADGAQLAQRAKSSIREIQFRVAKDRLKLAGSLLRDAWRCQV